MALTSVNYGNLPGWPGGQNQGGHVSMAVFWDMLSLAIFQDSCHDHPQICECHPSSSFGAMRFSHTVPFDPEEFLRPVHQSDLVDRPPFDRKRCLMAIYHGQAEPLFFLFFNDFDYLPFQNVRSETSWYLQFHGLFEEWRILLGPSLFGCSCGIFVNAAALQVL